MVGREAAAAVAATELFDGLPNAAGFVGKLLTGATLRRFR